MIRCLVEALPRLRTDAGHDVLNVSSEVALSSYLGVPGRTTLRSHCIITGEVHKR